MARTKKTGSPTAGRWSPSAYAGKDINKVVAKCISQDTYIDDGATSGDQETANRLIGEVTINEDGLLTYTGTLSKIFQKRRILL